MLEQHIADFMKLIVGDRNPMTAPEKHAQTPYLIAERWANWNLEAQVHQFEYHEFQGHNVWVGPQNPDKPFILLVAHHDTVPNCPGADDNGSGIAVLDAIARLYTVKYNEFNLALCLTDFEEGDPRIWTMYTSNTDFSTVSGRQKFWKQAENEFSDLVGFLGSYKLLKFLSNQDLLGNFEVMFNFETVGYSSGEQKIPKGIPKKLANKIERGNFVGIVGNKKAKNWMRRIKLVKSQPESIPALCLTVPGKGRLIPDSRRSDHALFWDAKLPAIMFTDTANFRNPNYHLPTDTKVDTEFIAGVTQLTIDALNLK